MCVSNKSAHRRGSPLTASLMFDSFGARVATPAERRRQARRNHSCTKNNSIETNVVLPEQFDCFDRVANECAQILVGKFKNKEKRNIN